MDKDKSFSLRCGFDGPLACDRQMDLMYARSFNIASTLLGNKQGSKEVNTTTRMAWISAA